MNKKKEIAYSRALVPIKMNLYKKILVGIVIFSVMFIIMYFKK